MGSVGSQLQILHGAADSKDQFIEALDVLGQVRAVAQEPLVERCLFAADVFELCASFAQDELVLGARGPLLLDSASAGLIGGSAVLGSLFALSFERALEVLAFFLLGQCSAVDAIGGGRDRSVAGRAVTYGAGVGGGTGILRASLSGAADQQGSKRK